MKRRSIVFFAALAAFLLTGVLSLSTIQNIVSSAGLDEAWWTGITIAAMLCIFLIIQSIVMAQKKRALKTNG